MLFLLTINCQLPARAQAPSFDDDIDDVENVPIDGGISIIAAAGIAYGIKKLKGSGKNK